MVLLLVITIMATGSVAIEPGPGHGVNCPFKPPHLHDATRSQVPIGRKTGPRQPVSVLFSPRTLGPTHLGNTHPTEIDSVTIRSPPTTHGDRERAVRTDFTCSCVSRSRRPKSEFCLLL